MCVCSCAATFVLLPHIAANQRLAVVKSSVLYWIVLWLCPLSGALSWSSASVDSRILCSVLRCRHCARCVCFDQQRAQNPLPAQPAIVRQAAGVLCAVRSTYCCDDCMLPAATATCWHGAVSGGSCVILLACSDMWAQRSLWLLCACTCCAEHLQLVPSTSPHSVAVRCSSRLTVDKALLVHTLSGSEWDCTGLLVPSWPRFRCSAVEACCTWPPCCGLAWILHGVSASGRLCDSASSCLRLLE